jgi:glycine oxidase
VKTSDVIIIGGGIIGLSLALELRKHGAQVQVVERGEPGREASHAAAGMLAFCDPHTPSELQDLCCASAELYPEFVHEIEDESGMRVDFRTEGTIALGDEAGPSPCASARPLSSDELRQLESKLAGSDRATYFEEQSVDNRALVAAALKATKHRNVELATGATVTGVEVEDASLVVRTQKTHFAAPVVVNCAGAWAGEVEGYKVPVRPVKGQMLSVVTSERNLLRHVVRAPDVYLVPRSDGRILIGATVEEAGYDKRVDADTIQRLHQAASNLVPEIGQARIHEVWAGLRPAAPDNLPMLGAPAIPGYFVATGHFRNGILLSAVTAKIMADLVRGAQPGVDISRFSPARFA